MHIWLIYWVNWYLQRLRWLIAISFGDKRWHHQAVDKFMQICFPASRFPKPSNIWMNRKCLNWCLFINWGNEKIDKLLFETKSSFFIVPRKLHLRCQHRLDDVFVLTNQILKFNIFTKINKNSFFSVSGYFQNFATS